MTDLIDDLLEEPAVLWMIGVGLAVWAFLHPAPVERWARAHLLPPVRGPLLHARALVQVGDVTPTTTGLALCAAGAITVGLGLLLVALLQRRLRDQFPIG
jgi:hypothetical protein